MRFLRIRFICNCAEMMKFFYCRIKHKEFGANMFFHEEVKNMTPNDTMEIKWKWMRCEHREKNLPTTSLKCLNHIVYVQKKWQSTTEKPTKFTIKIKNKFSFDWNFELKMHEKWKMFLKLLLNIVIRTAKANWFEMIFSSRKHEILNTEHSVKLIV